MPVTVKLPTILRKFAGDEAVNVTDFLSVGVVANGADWGQEYTYHVADDGTITYRRNYADDPDKRYPLNLSVLAEMAESAS